MPNLDEESRDNQEKTNKTTTEIEKCRQFPRRQRSSSSSSRLSIRNSIRESLSYGTFRRSLVRRTRSCGSNDKERPKILPKRSKTFKFFTTTVPKYLFVTSVIRIQPPTTPLLIKDPPSSDNGSDLDEVKQPPSLDPALLNGSSSNFGSAGGQQQQRTSAPTTPQTINNITTTTATTTITQNNCGNSSGGSGSLIEPPQSQPCTPGCISPSIQRSPSHSLFTKCDKASLKHLSTSTPAMTAQAQLPEPPSPKTTKEPKKVPTMSKARQKKFNRHFPSVDDEKVLNYYSCALIGDILLQGHLYITKNYFAFYSNVFGYVTKLLIPMLSVEKITKEKTARIIPNAVGIATSEDKHVFGSLMSRDNTYRYMIKVWELAQNASLLVVEPEIEPVPVSDSDSSETRDGESGRDSPLPIPNRLQIKVSDSDNVTTTASSTTGTTKKNNNNNSTVYNVKESSQLDIINVLKRNLSKFSRLPRQSLILYATTLLLILLFLSATVLLYRISKIQNRFSFALNDKIIINDNNHNINNNNNNNHNKNDNNHNNNNNNNGGDDDDGEIYNNLYQWQTHLHTKSAGAVHNFLDTNLDQIAKVRQSLEALSTLLTTPNQQQQQQETTTTKQSS